MSRKIISLQQLFQTFAALPVDKTTHLTSQAPPILTDDQSEGSVRSGVCTSTLIKSLMLSAVSLDDVVINSWIRATRYSDSFPRGSVKSHGAGAVPYRH